MRWCRSGLVLGFLAVAAVPIAAQTKTTVKAASSVKPTAARSKATTTKRASTAARTPTVTKAVAEPEAVIEYPVDGKIVLSTMLRARLQSLIAGSTMTYDEAVTGWRSHTQLVGAMNAASGRHLPFPAIHHEVVANRMFLVDAVASVRGATAPPLLAE